MRSLFYILAALLAAGLVINYTTKYSTEVFIIRAVFNAVLLRNKYLGMSIGNPQSTMMGITTPDWKEVSLEAQTLYNFVRFNAGRKLESDVAMRDGMISLAPPVSYHNSLGYQYIPEIRNSLLVHLRDRFYVDQYFGKDKRGKVLLLVHGGGGFAGKPGGFELGSIVEHMQTRFNSSLTHILSVGYRLMALTEEEKSKRNEFATKFSEQADDVIQAYQWLLKKFNAEDVVVVGSSFGAALSAEFLRRVAVEKLPMPKAAILVGGPFDLTLKLGYSSLNARNTLMSTDRMISIMQRLFKAEDSPLVTWKNVDKRVHETNLLIIYSKDEEVTKDNEAFIQILKDIKHPSVQVIADNMMIHCHPFFEYYFAEAKQAMSKMLDFVDSQN
ncbi:hypothetical protein C9374_003515 [Naegleria lovaniensis]|uniref:Alpha/beta hydrolase fold-3 domain-containing protein n=1 Tax=Naegleria lovaniensis TaxID=51637 RepID=A0AA88GN16_NAELO|nr:uncharacterized protein C9374_003515 [Naegleria lovaniensis]KAG2385700.1 hypothetical protein C9374_003515 [Naegleria lovaniensis]